MGFRDFLHMPVASEQPPGKIAQEACLDRCASTAAASGTRTSFRSTTARRDAHVPKRAAGPAKTRFLVVYRLWRWLQTRRCAILWPTDRNRPNAPAEF